MNPIKRLYNWVLSLAEKPSGPLALFLIAFAESSFFPIPPDVLLIALVLGAAAKAWRFALICSVGSILGGTFGYWIGHELWWAASETFSGVADGFFDYHSFHRIDEAKFWSMKKLYDNNAFAIVFSAGFTPIPYKLITISSGAFDVNFAMFLIASSVSRAGRFFLVAALLKKYGAPVKDIIDKHFNWLALLFCLLLFGGFYALKFLKSAPPDEPPAKEVPTP